MAGQSGCVNGSPDTGTLELNLNDVYFERHHSQWLVSEHLYVELTLGNRGEETLAITDNFLRDGRDTVYKALLLQVKGKEAYCMECRGLKTLRRLAPGEEANGFFMVLEDVARDASGLRLVIVADDQQTELPLPDGNRLKIVERFE